MTVFKSGVTKKLDIIDKHYLVPVYKVGKDIKFEQVFVQKVPVARLAKPENTEFTNRK